MGKPSIKEPKRLNLIMAHWAHRLLRVTAAEGLVSMRLVVEASALAFAELDDDQREFWYDEAKKLTRAEVRKAREAHGSTPEATSGQ